jgi:hypothetical protein
MPVPSGAAQPRSVGRMNRVIGGFLMPREFRLPGAPVVWRSRPHGIVGYVAPHTVVTDSVRVTVLFQHAGVVCKRRSGKRGGPQGRDMIQWDGSHLDYVWPGPSALRLHMWGTSFSVIRSWSFERDCACGWYVNLESPWRRTVLGFDSEDLVLDLTVSDDLSTWAWKDADELDWAVENGRFSSEESIRSAGLHAVELIQARQWPFVEDWSEFSPNPDWPVPSVPAGWDDPSL